MKSAIQFRAPNRFCYCVFYQVKEKYGRSRASNQLNFDDIEATKVVLREYQAIRK
jgi:hypothetical protein